MLPTRITTQVVCAWVCVCGGGGGWGAYVFVVVYFISFFLNLFLYKVVLKNSEIINPCPAEPGYTLPLQIV